jgi:hypothetical protein
MAVATAAFLLPLAAEPIYTAPVTSGSFTVVSLNGAGFELFGPGWYLRGLASKGHGSEGTYVGDITALRASGADTLFSETNFPGDLHHGVVVLTTHPFLVTSEAGQGNLLVDYDIHIWPHCDEFFCPLPAGVSPYQFKSSGTLSASVKWGNAINRNEGLFDSVYDPVTDTFKNVPYPPKWELFYPTVSLFVPEPGAGALLGAGLAALALVGRRKAAGRA